MATVRSQHAICRIVEDRILELEMEAGRKPIYNGIIVMDDVLLVVDFQACNLQFYNRHDGKLISASHRLESIPYDICIISKIEVAVCLHNGTVIILSLKSIDDVKLVKSLRTGFSCYSLTKWNSDKLVVSGRTWKDGMLCWGIVSIRDGHLDSTLDICEGLRTHMAIKDNTLYISCYTLDSSTNGVHAYDMFNPQTKIFLYRHQNLEMPWSIMVDKDCVYLFDNNSNIIHQLKDSGQLVTIHTVSTRPIGTFFDEQHEFLYTTSWESNLITIYKIDSLHQPDSVIPAEILNMDTGSLQVYKKALCDGYEKVYNIRVMVVGQYGVGKTTLTQRLLGKNVNISERHSTEGIDVHVECSKVSLSTGEWTTQEKNAEKLSRLQRIVRLLNEYSNKHESKREQDRQIELVTSVKNGNGQDDQPIMAEPSTKQKVKQTSSQAVESPIVRLGPDASSGIHSNKNEMDTVMKILKQVNENLGKLVKDAVQYAAVAFWDFAGQCAFYTTHQTFLTSRAIYLLVIDFSQQVTDLIKDDECFFDAKGKKLCNITEMIEIWLNMIHSCAPSSHPGRPPVILIGTHVDKIPEKFRQKVIDEYFMKVRQMLKNKPLVYHLMDNIAIDNTQCDPRLETLKSRIFELASQQPHWGEEKPARWLPLEQAIMTMKYSDAKVVPLSLIEEINRSSSVKIEDRSELEMFLSFQHAIGTILYFNEYGLREKIMLDPQWMIDVFTSLIAAKKFIEQNPIITKEWFEFEEKGKLTHKLIDAIWTKKDKPDFHDNKEYLLLVMKKLNIIARPMAYTLDGKSVKKEDYYLAPCILRQETPREIICPELDPNEKSTSALCFMCKENCLPPPIFHRLVGACLTHWPIAKQDEESLIYCGSCVFDIDNYHRLSLHFIGHVIFARVTILGVTDISKSSKLCSKAREFIFENLLKIIGNLGQSLEFEPHIQCPNCDADSIKGMIAVTELQKENVVVCNSHAKSHTLESHQLLNFWFDDGEQTAVDGNGRENRLKVYETSQVPAKVPSASRNIGSSKEIAPD
ncbi:hypothetical protein ACJMK2_001481 [Sinanodonta woodiana]|uniref:non-specific serine/threonine protein kinase n=1 Tax=Sinanodonta woodiana TaxID=1069815 RepID=A0ABD3XSD4_SINWO